MKIRGDKKIMSKEERKNNNQQIWQADELEKIKQATTSFQKKQPLIV
jgi:hypothetical protein